MFYPAIGGQVCKFHDLQNNLLFWHSIIGRDTVVSCNHNNQYILLIQMDCILLFNNPDKTLAITNICNNYLIDQNVIKHTQAQICMCFCSFFFLKGAWFRVQDTSVVWLYLCQTLSIKQLSCSNNKHIFDKHVSRKSFWHKSVPWLHNPEWNRFLSNIAACVSQQYWWTYKSDKQIHNAASSYLRNC